MFFDDERSSKLRPQILTELVGQYMNDAERAALYGLPESTRIRERAKIVSPQNLTIGEHCWIGEGAVLDASGGLEIGEHTSIGLNTLIFTHSSWLANMTLSNHSGSDLIERKPVKIGKGCFIGGLVVIMAGVTIGDFATVQPNSVVAKDVPPRTLVSGNPARVFQRYDDEYIQSEVDRVKGENERRRKLAEERGDAPTWGAPAGDFTTPAE
ncbi:acetyltransferase [Amycolatopsis antarctica]|uniref:Acetyltransferase n=1 Tax=Amycolatopsis antarctica TaxID=1854586 RepID=A0A263D4L0_9PSEU|nr:acyltransferase [Amycolatopsis antarctica]OZM73434.1 acetyltransferase [Amycolatopsis antarctica]